MSDNGRKRSRKTKLVPRDFSEFIDDDCFLQEPPSKLPFYTKRKKDGEASTSSLSFSVKVEIEDIEDSLPEDDPSSYMKYLFSLSKDSGQDIDEDAWDRKIQDLDKTFVMDTHKMVKLFHCLHRKFPQEKEAVMHTRNAWGKVFHEKPNEEPPRHPQDLELNKVMSQWKIWLFSSRTKETPFSYKCYICNDAWWSYMDFKGHIRSHEACKIMFEVVEQECHVVSYEGEIPDPVDIAIDGKCFKCTKNYKQHLDYKRYSDYRYYCPHCKDHFLTCRSLNHHEGSCEKNPKRAALVVDNILSKKTNFTDYSCRICTTIFLTKVDKYEHMSICHRVRSDEPISTPSKICRVCEGTFYIFSYHVCTKKNIIHECMHCHGRFQNKVMLDAHLRLWGDPFKCSVCDKMVMRQCMGAEHYARHSENFQMMYRCLPCAKLKLFYTDDAFRMHRTKTHKRVDSRRPSWERIIVPKIMLEQCEFNPNARRRRSNPVKKVIKTPMPAKTATRTDKSKERRKTSSIEKENNYTIAEDNSMPSENSLNPPENKDFINNVTTEDSMLGENSPNAPEDSKDFPLNQITETLDMKPDIIVKEEKLSDTEDSKTDLIKIIETQTKEKSKEIPKSVREQSNKFKQIIQEVQESKLSNIFIASKNITEPTIIKEEIKQEEDFEEDLIILDSSSESIKQESENSDLNLLNLEPEVILQAGYRKRKIYKCNKCDFEGYHREYKEHISNHCKTPSKLRTVPTEQNYTCTKCDTSYDTLKRYAQHFVYHNYRFMTCPQCVTMFDSITKLVGHLNTHVKNQFVRMQLINKADDEGRTKVCQCKTCKEVIELKNTFSHWESHLEMQPEPEKSHNQLPQSAANLNTSGESPLEPEVLKRILDMLQNQEKLSRALYKKVKVCFVCKRYFDRQNDCKRHLVEHLLEDAYANIYNTEFLMCQICGESHKKPDAYKKHMRDHGSLPIYQCGLCDKTFSDSSNFTKHKKVHNLKAYMCDICNKKFQAKLSLEKHIKMHMSTEPFRCERCDRLFYDRSFFKRHQRNHHERPAARFRCAVCKDKFESLRVKWDHMWEVHKQRKEKADCPLCKKSYRKISDVRKHTQMEHGLNISLANVFELVDKYHSEYDKTDRIEKMVGRKEKADTVVETLVAKGNDDDDDSDDDVLLIEEERETLVIYDDDDKVGVETG